VTRSDDVLDDDRWRAHAALGNRSAAPVYVGDHGRAMLTENQGQLVGVVTDMQFPELVHDGSPGVAADFPPGAFPSLVYPCVISPHHSPWAAGGVRGRGKDLRCPKEIPSSPRLRRAAMKERVRGKWGLWW
jgi:hypothetical protein